MALPGKAFCVSDRSAFRARRGYANAVERHHRRKSRINPRVNLHKPRKEMHEPLCRKIGRGADGKDARGFSLHQAFRSYGEAVKRVPYTARYCAAQLAA